MSVDLELYRIFHTVACYEIVSDAAEALFISQPAVSKSIKKLENNIGITLFSRNSRGVKLTNEGKIFFVYIERALQEILIGEGILNKLKKVEQGEIKIGVSTTLCKYFLIPNLKPFMNEYPNVKIKIINKTTFDTLRLVEEGEMDFGIISRPFNYEGYNFIELAKIQDIFVAEKQYLNSFNPEELKDIFANCPIMLLEGDNITRKYIDEYFKENNILVKPEIEISNMDFLIEFAKIGLGVAAVIRAFVEEDLLKGNLVEVPLLHTITERTIGIVSNKKIPLSIAAQTFISYIKNKIIK